MVKIEASEINERFPLSVSLLGNWILENLRRDQEAAKEMGVPVLEEKGSEKWAHDFAQVVLTHSPRQLYDFFDAQGIIISISLDKKDQDTFLVWNNQERHSYTAPTRSEAEQKGFMDTFQTLEEKLKQTSSTIR